MQLKRIEIKNFKGLVEAEFKPTSFSCLVGENNAGKSTILQAIVHALRRTNQLSDEVFYDASQPVEFRLEFEGVTASHLMRLAEEARAKIEPIVEEGRLSLLFRYVSGQRVEIKVLRMSPKELRYTEEGIAEVLKGTKGAAIKAAVLNKYPEFPVEDVEFTKQTDAREFLEAKVALLPADAFQLAERPLPSGIGASIDRLLPEPIYIAAVKNLGDDLKTTASTPFGRLLALLLDEMNPELAQIQQSLEELNRILNRHHVHGQVVDARHPRVINLENKIQEFLRENFPTAKVELDIPPPELKSILGAAKVFVDDGSRDLIDNKGDGIKRALTFALFQTLAAGLEPPLVAEAPDAPARQPLMILFEEPELYLHPRSQRVLFSTLQQLSSQHQVVVTTHSPLFFAPGVTATFVRVAKVDRQPKPSGRLWPVDFQTDAAKAQTFKLARFENTDPAFFSRRVVLFEGESDDFFLGHLAKQLDANWDFEKRNVAMVRVSGKGNFSKYRSFFEAFGIEVKIVADLDALFDGYEHLGAPAEATQVRATAIQMIDERIAQLDIRPELRSEQIKDKAKQESFRTKYEAARMALRQFQQTQQLQPGTIDTIDQLFLWEDNVTRTRACIEDDASRAAIVPLLDQLRQAGICVLSRGAIEQYYPAACPPNSSKPQRAIGACALISNQAEAIVLSPPLGQGRKSELQEVLAECFRAL